MPNLHQSTDFIGRRALPFRIQDDVFRYCSFQDIEVEGNGFDGVAIRCTFSNCSWYWGIFNIATFIDVRFEGCHFRGTCFSGCTFVRCSFKDCTFSKDNLGGDCQFSDCSWFECVQTESRGLPKGMIRAEKPHHTGP